MQYLNNYNLRLSLHISFELQLFFTFLISSLNRSKACLIKQSLIVLVSITMIKHNDHKQLWEGPDSFQLTTLRSHSLAEKSQSWCSNRSGACRQDLMQRPWRSVTNWLASHSLLILPSSSAQDNQSRIGTTHSELGPPT